MRIGDLISGTAGLDLIDRRGRKQSVPPPLGKSSIAALLEVEMCPYEVNNHQRRFYAVQSPYVECYQHGRAILRVHPVGARDAIVYVHDGDVVSTYKATGNTPLGVWGEFDATLRGGSSAPATATAEPRRLGLAVHRVPEGVVLRCTVACSNSEMDSHSESSVGKDFDGRACVAHRYAEDGRELFLLAVLSADADTQVLRSVNGTYVAECVLINSEELVVEPDGDMIMEWDGQRGTELHALPGRHAFVLRAGEPGEAIPAPH